ncbi:MAG TPA: TolC family protein [Tepidisphaeraceae bacterium]|jgi:outer membrane protein TolC|nr:TolC family protein [Tepidisphaeraceae bacterium]
MNRSDRRRANSISLVSSALACLLVSGCAVDQKKEVAAYRTVIDGPKPAAFEYHAGQRLSLEGALLLANRNDEQLASSGEDYLQALVDKERQFSTFLPTISLQPTYTWLDHRSSNISASAKQGTTDAPVTGSYNVFNGFQDVANYRRSGYTAEQRKALLLDLQQTILLNLVQTYYSVLTNERSVMVLTNSAQLQNERVRDMEGRQRAGLARPLDVAQSEAQAAATRVQLIQAQNNVRTSRIALAFLTSAAVQDAPLDDRMLVPEKFPSQDELTLAAQKTRQDVQAASAAVEAARQNVQSAIGEYYPSVAFNIENFLHKESLSTLTVWEGTVQVNVPIFTAGQIDANVRTAWSQLRQAWLNDQRTRRLVSEQVRTAYENIHGSKLRLHDLHIEVAAARDALNQARFSYSAGLATNLDVLTAIDQVNSAELSLASEELNYKVFYMQLLRAEGRLARPDSPLPPPGSPSSKPSIDEITPVAPMTMPANAPTTAPATSPTTAPANAGG